ncbi:MAG: RNB domain-containing ribonuclease [Solirubrobacteraceae bacterium]
MSEDPRRRGAVVRRAANAGGAGGRTPGSRFVAVLARKGRFLMAEPFFAAEGGLRGRAGDGARQLVVGPVRGRGHVRAGAGDLVLLSSVAPGRSRVERVIGRPENVRDVIEALMLDRGLERRFAGAVEREAADAAQRVAHEPADGERAARLDLRALGTFTIDPPDARDFDDAVSAEAGPDGSVRVWVHIADVSAFVPEGSALDHEARRRATSVYVPGAVEPMLPDALSGDLCSLRAGEDRFAVSVELEVLDGQVRRSAFHRSLIRSDARLEYDQVDRIFAGTERASAPWADGLDLARRAAIALGERMARRGMLDVDSFEPDLTIGEDGSVSVRMAGWSAQATQAAPATRLSGARAMIEHLMVAANEAVAGHLAARRQPCLYRVHERPEPHRVERLVAQLAALELPTPPLPERMSASQAAEIIAVASAMIRKHLDARASSGADDGVGLRMAVSSLLLRTLQQAYYSPRNVGHAGLGSVAYCHFTSPIRRYPDLECHRALLASLGSESPPPRAESLAELGEWTSQRERHAMTIERDADDVARCFALEERLFEDGWETCFRGHVVGLIAAGAFVAFGGEDGPGSLPCFEGMLPVRRLGAKPARGGRERRARSGGGVAHDGAPERDWWELAQEDTALRAEPSARTVRLGQAMDISVVRVERTRGRVELAPAGAAPRAGGQTR